MDSKSEVRGRVICGAELRLRAGCGGGGRIAVELQPNVAAEFSATALFLMENLEELTRTEAWKEDEDEGVNAIRELKRTGAWKDESPIPPDFPQRAFADFDHLGEFVDFLTGNKELRFYFDDEAERTNDPLIDP